MTYTETASPKNRSPRKPVTRLLPLYITNIHKSSTTVYRCQNCCAESHRFETKPKIACII
ncbi:hypothetical protein WG66_003646 [Moniliophthora roreri]|nr:hypothetical protein WG66_003646 [Moniliophthora roreri]